MLRTETVTGFFPDEVCFYEIPEGKAKYTPVYMITRDPESKELKYAGKVTGRTQYFTERQLQKNCDIVTEATEEEALKEVEDANETG